MHKAIQIRNEGVRGCGWRKVGGLYLVTNAPARACGRLPIPAEKCPCCSRGIKPARGWTWIDGDEILRASPDCPLRGTKTCHICPVHGMVLYDIGMAGLIWVGERYYPTVAHFTREAETMGISRRIAAVPKDFKLGETFVMLAHRNAILKGPAKLGEEFEYVPGIFRIFKPTAIEAVVSGDEDDDKIEALLKRGLTPVKIEREEQMEMA